MAFFSLQPINRGESMSDEVAQAVQILRDRGLRTEIGPQGTTIVGELEEIMDAVSECHESLSADGTRVNSELVIETKPGIEPGDLRGRVESVKERLEEPPAV